MMELPASIVSVLGEMAQAIADRRRHFPLSSGTLSPIAAMEYRPLVVAFLADRVEKLTAFRPEGQLTVRMAESNLLYGYLGGGWYSFVLCPVGTPIGEVATRDPVLQAWVISPWGLFPEGFDEMPADGPRRTS